MGKISFAINNTTIILAYDGKNFRVKRLNQIGEDSFEETETSKKILEAIRNKQLDSKTSPIPAIVDLSESLKDSPFLISNGIVYIDGKTAPKAITNKILQYKENGIPYESIVNFYKNVVKNPSKSAQDELFLFLEHNGHPFTEEGYFLAYKAVRPDFYSKHGYSEGSSKNVLNAPQTWVEMPRELVDSNRHNTCSTGLHCANYDYAKRSYGTSSDLLIEVIVDPKDVVSIPSDYNNTKMRVCRYFVVGPCEGESTKALYKEWNKQHITDPNAPTNMVTEGESEELDNEIIDSLVVSSEVPSLTVDPVVESEIVGYEPENTYYKSYVNSVNVTWFFKKYDNIKETLIYCENRFADARHTYIKKGDKVPVSWKPVGDVLSLWPVKTKSPLTGFVSTVDKFISGGLSSDKATIEATTDTINGKEGDIFSNIVNNFIDNSHNDVFKNKVDTRLNYLTQPRENGKFVKRNP